MIAAAEIEHDRVWLSCETLSLSRYIGERHRRDVSATRLEEFLKSPVGFSDQ
jgi:hypothetical protein